MQALLPRAVAPCQVRIAAAVLAAPPELRGGAAVLGYNP